MADAIAKLSIFPLDDGRRARTRLLNAVLHAVGVHLCNELCRCPVDGLVLLYHAPTDEHACQDIDCVFAHGMKHRTWMPVISRQGVRARYNQAITDAMAAQPIGRHPDVATQHVYVTAFRAIGLTLAAPVDNLGKVVRLDKKKAECSCLEWDQIGRERIGRDGIRRTLVEGDEIDPYCPEHGE